MFFCHALVPLLCPFVCSHLNISPFEWYSKCWTSSLVIPICSFHVLLCMVRVLKPVWIGHVDKCRVVLHHFSHSSIKQKLCNLQKSMQQFMPLFLFEVPLTSGRLGCKWFVHSPSACLKLQDGGTFKEIGNAFQVKGELANVMTLTWLCPSCWLVMLHVI